MSYRPRLFKLLKVNCFISVALYKKTSVREFLDSRKKYGRIK